MLNTETCFLKLLLIYKVSIFKQILFSPRLQQHADSPLVHFWLPSIPFISFFFTMSLVISSPPPCYTPHTPSLLLTPPHLILPSTIFKEQITLLSASCSCDKFMLEMAKINFSMAITCKLTRDIRGWAPPLRVPP